MEGAVWRADAPRLGGGGGTATGEGALDCGGGGGGGPEEEAASWPPCPVPCGPDMPPTEVLLLKPTLAQPRLGCWLLLAQDPVVFDLFLLFRLDERGDFLVPCVFFQLPTLCLGSLAWLEALRVVVVVVVGVAAVVWGAGLGAGGGGGCSGGVRRDSLKRRNVSARNATLGGDRGGGGTEGDGCP